MYKAEDAKVVCEERNDTLEKEIKRYITEGYVPKSISQGESFFVGKKHTICALLVKMKDEISGTFEVEGKGTLDIEGKYKKRMK